MRLRHLFACSMIAACLGALLLPPAASAAPDKALPSPNLVVSKGSAAPKRAAAPSPATLPPGYPMWVLQLNLCNSGLAGCYEDGQSIPEGYDVITSKLPDVVTLNEVCRADVEVSLFPSMAEMYPADWTFWAFMPAFNRATNAPYQCANGDQYGIGVLGHVPADQWTGLDAFGDIYPDQRADSNELRAWLCTAALGNYYACTTHLASGAGSVALAQCEYLMSSVVPAVWDYEGAVHPSVVGGDLNLKYQGSPNVQDCVPAGWYRKGDGDVQHIMATNDLPFGSSEEIGMDHTDHPGWLVRTTVS
ncbi:hypothetical protein [Flindersiella endophytica]